MASSKRPARLFYTLSECADLTGLNYRTLLKMAQADLIPCSHLGASRIYLVPAAWLNQAVEGTLEHWISVCQARGLMPAPESEAVE